MNLAGNDLLFDMIVMRNAMSATITASRAALGSDQPHFMESPDLYVDTIEALSPEDQHTLIELIQRRLAERRRSEIAHNAVVTLQAARGGRARQGSLDDLKHDLLAEP